MNKKIVIIGAGGHGKVIANIAKLTGYEEILFIDDDVNKKECGQYKVIGDSKQIDSLIKEDYEFAVAVGDNKIRERIFEVLVNKGARLPVLIHPTAVIDETVTIGNGTVIMASAVINAASNIGNACIINTASTIDHDCIIGGYVHISPGTHVAGSVKIGQFCWLGIGASMINNISVVENCVIGAGSAVVNDINEPGIYVGLPIRKVK